jgi:hypothetical protein
VQIEEFYSTRKLVWGDNAAIPRENRPTFSKLLQLWHLRIVLAIATMDISCISHVLNPGRFPRQSGNINMAEG